MTAAKKRIESIQMIRGTAVIGIVLFHIGYGPSESANWGVDMFFILSGFFLMRSTETAGGVRYWKSKLIRLCPLYYSVTIASVVLHWVIPSLFRSTRVTWETFVKSILFIPCYSLNGTIYPIFGVGWTLNVEMFVYLVFFAAMRISWRRRGEIVSLLLLTFILLGALFEPQSAVLRVWSIPQLFDFVVGIGLYELDRKINAVPMGRLTSWTIVLLSLVCLFSGKYILRENFSFLWNTAWSTATLTAALFGLKNCSFPSALVKIGDMSYSIYLSHNFVVRPVCHFLMKDTAISVVNTAAATVTVGIVIGCSWIVYCVYEKWLAGVLMKKL